MNSWMSSAKKRKRMRKPRQRGDKRNGEIRLTELLKLRTSHQKKLKRDFRKKRKRRSNKKQKRLNRKKKKKREN